jgi:oligopeptide transport system permease protein
VIAFLIKRFLWCVATLWVVYTVTFFLMWALPGGPFSSEKNVPDVIKRNIERRYKLDRPLSEQYFSDMKQRLPPSFDFGPSFRKKDYTVNEVIAHGFPVSATLGIVALLFALSLGLTAGVMSALRRQSWVDVGLMASATLGIAVPNFILAGLSIIVFVFMLRIFPAAGWGTLRQIILPALVLGAPFAAYIARLTRTSMLEVLGQDYIRTAYAKGLPTRHVVLRHAMQGAMLPVVSYLGPAVAGILTGSLVVERIFALPGIGGHFIEAALQSDHMISMGMVLIYTLLLFLMNTLVDISYSVLDPRVKLS